MGTPFKNPLFSPSIFLGRTWGSGAEGSGGEWAPAAARGRRGRRGGPASSINTHSHIRVGAVINFAKAEVAGERKNKFKGFPCKLHEKREFNQLIWSSHINTGPIQHPYRTCRAQRRGGARLPLPSQNRRAPPTSQKSHTQNALPLYLRSP